jgi:tRNA(Ile)-lysidine synthase
VTNYEHAIQADQNAVELLYHQLDEAQRRYQLFPNPFSLPLERQPTHIVIGVSGGADSVCLLHTLAHFREQWRLNLHVAHLDHNLRPESSTEAVFVAKLAADLRLPFYHVQLAAGSLHRQPGGLEAAARRARYAFLIQMAINVTPPAQVPCIALAHHADDQAETLLLNLVRGSGLQGLSGMKWINQLAIRDFMDTPIMEKPNNPAQVVQLVRPLLNVRRSEILAYLNAQHLAWCEDASNQDTTLLRNRIRHEILPQLEQMNPRLVETLGRTAQILAGEVERVHTIDQATLVALCVEPEPAQLRPQPERIVLDLPKFLSLDRASQRGVLRQGLARVQTSLDDVAFDLIERWIEDLHFYAHTGHAHAGGPHPLLYQLAWSVAAATTAAPARFSLHRSDALPFLPDHPYLDEAWRQTIRSTPLLNGTEIQLPSGWALTVAEIDRDALPENWQRNNKPWQAYLDAEQCGVPVLTTPQPGWRFAPLGMDGHHKALGDFFTNHKTPPSLRPGWPVVIDQTKQTVLWVCGLRLGHQACVTPATQRVLHLGWSQKER